MRHITQVTVTYGDDGTQETFDGIGNLRVVDTYKEVETWPADEPDRRKPKTHNEPVHYLTIAFTPEVIPV